MIWETLDENLIVLNLEAKTSTDVFQKLGGRLIAADYCKESYIQALIEREKDFPTGINMGNVGIAMPHTDKEHVKREGVAIGILKEPVHFFQMGTTDEPVDAKLIFMLAVQNPEEHLVFLQRILMLLQDQEVLKQLLQTKDKKAVIEVIRKKEEKY